MEQTAWYDAFMEIVNKKYPKSTQLIKVLTKLLSLEREAIYRRLRREVNFSAHEIVTIASAWNISLDEISGINVGRIAFQMKAINYIEPSEEEANFLHNIIQSIDYLKHFPSTEFMDICNVFPRQLLAGYEYLNKFYLFKWAYQYGNEKEVAPFSQVNISEEKLNITKEYYKAIKQVPNTSFIFDCRIFDYLVNDIKYFCSILLITEEEKELIKKDILSLIDYLLDVANKGCYPETQNKVNLFISQLKIDTGYSYTYTPEVNICYIHVFEKFEIYSYHSEMVSNFISWMQLKKRTSIQISEVDEKSRIEFFMKQKRLVKSL
ncbi:MAG: hypothetical protein FWF70_06785 [Bacteroidetes bacterium]|nr:hypothetical protein [Bacteroidota bacterium]MCL1968705.1 hypothetical protein [Bacteroidota bacterium]